MVSKIKMGTSDEVIEVNRDNMTIRHVYDLAVQEPIITTALKYGMTNGFTEEQAMVLCIAMLTKALKETRRGWQDYIIHNPYPPKVEP